MYHFGNFFFLHGIDFPRNDNFNYPGDANAFFLIVIFVTALNSYGVLKLYDLLVLFKFKKVLSFYAALIFAFGTIFWGYASTLFSHSTAATSLILAIYFVIKGRKQDIFLSGLVSGFLATIEYASLIFVPIFLIYTALKQKNFKKIFLFGFGLSLPLVCLLLYNYIAFGNPLAFSYQYQANFNDAASFKRPLFDGLKILLASSWRGLFFFNPVLIFSLFGMFVMLQRDSKVFFFLVILWLGYLVLFAKYSYLEGGVSYGPRYLITTIPILILFIAQFLSTISLRNFNLISIPFGILLAVSVFHSFLGAYTSIFTYPESNQNPIYEITFPQFLHDIKNSFILKLHPSLFALSFAFAFLLFLYLQLRIKSCR